MLIEGATDRAFEAAIDGPAGDAWGRDEAVVLALRLVTSDKDSSTHLPSARWASARREPRAVS